MTKTKKYLAVAGLAVLIGAGAAAYKFYYQGAVYDEIPETLEKGEAFDFSVLQKEAAALAARAYEPSLRNLPDELKNLSYDQHRDIRFVRENGPWYNRRRPFEVQFFHLGGIFEDGVRINQIINGKSYPFKYSPDYFDYGKNHLDGSRFSNLTYAGFRLHYPLNRPDYFDELVSFLGASYFRALGTGQKYGLSARGLAIDTAVQTGEEFPLFKEFWIERPRRSAAEIRVYALLDSPSVAGAYAFVIQPGLSTTMDVDAVLYPRKKINKLGVAPLTSMFLFGENNKHMFDDHRPEVHDSDGLLVWNGNDEWLWRPLDNSRYLRISSFEDNNPKGFGLLQRDKNPEHYLDFEAFYEQRPSAWVEPLDNWGKGVVQLVEIPSQQEIHDNIVAFWIPQEEIVPGKEYRYRYRLHWTGDAPVDSHLAKVTATYNGIGGISGLLEQDKRKIVIDFSAPQIDYLKEAIENGEVSADISFSEGKFLGSHLIYNPLTKGPTLYMDFRPNGKTSEIRAVLKKDGKPVSEVWSYQWLP